MLYIINFAVLLFLSVAWTRKNWPNMAYKLMLLSLALANAFFALQAFGYVVRTSSL